MIDECFQSARLSEFDIKLVDQPIKSISLNYITKTNPAMQNQAPLSEQIEDIRRAIKIKQQQIARCKADKIKIQQETQNIKNQSKNLCLQLVKKTEQISKADRQIAHIEEKSKSLGSKISQIKKQICETNKTKGEILRFQTLNKMWSEKVDETKKSLNGEELSEYYDFVTEMYKLVNEEVKQMRYSEAIELLEELIGDQDEEYQMLNTFKEFEDQQGKLEKIYCLICGKEIEQKRIQKEQGIDVCPSCHDIAVEIENQSILKTEASEVDLGDKLEEEQRKLEKQKQKLELEKDKLIEQCKRMEEEKRKRIKAEKDLEEIYNEVNCVICTVQRKNCLNINCNHIVCCYSCGIIQSQCPLCRAEMQPRRVYL